MSSHQFNKLSYSQGFTLIEFAVSMTIAITIITTVVYNQRAYNDKSELINQADKIGLTLTEAQIYGTSARELTPGSQNFNTPYGLAFNLSGGNASTYIYFADHNGNRRYDDDWSCPVGGGSECLAKFAIPEGNYIESVCAIPPIGVDNCTLTSRIDVSFARPNAAARLSFYKTLDGSSVDVPWAVGTKVNLRSPQGNSRSITIYNTGQISVQ